MSFSSLRNSVARLATVALACLVFQYPSNTFFKSTLAILVCADAENDIAASKTTVKIIKRKFFMVEKESTILRGSQHKNWDFWNRFMLVSGSINQSASGQNGRDQPTPNWNCPL